MAAQTKRTRKLGRGLSSLINDPAEVRIAPEKTTQHIDTQVLTKDQAGPISQLLLLGAIVPGRHQPRQHFDELALEQLAQSIRTTGVMQPIAVRPLEMAGDAPVGAQWELIAGERRWRAAQRAGLETIPAIVVDLDDREAAEWSLVENLQREDLNPIERAQAFSKLLTEFNFTQAQLAKRVGLERSTIANLIRLTELEEPIQSDIAAGRLSPGHGKALLSLTPGRGRIKLAIIARDGGWSVRRLEQHIQNLNDPTSRSAGDRKIEHDSSRIAALKNLEGRLQDRFTTKVKVRLDSTGSKGRLMIEFFDLEQLDGILRNMGVPPEKTN